MSSASSGGYTDGSGGEGGDSAGECSDAGYESMGVAASGPRTGGVFVYNSSRLQPIYMDAKSGGQEHVGWWDSLLEKECKFYRMLEHDLWRCFPRFRRAPRRAYLDATCERMGSIDEQLMCDEYAADTTGNDDGTVVYAFYRVVGALEAGSMSTHESINNECVPLDMPSTARVEIEPMNMDDFCPATVSME
jgi:hypothetical protein